MKKRMLLILALALFAFSFGCNKQKPHRLDYSHKMEKGMYNPHKGGLPGEGRVGPTEMENSYHGLHKAGEGAQAHDGSAKKPDAAKDEVKKDEVKKDDGKKDDGKKEEQKDDKVETDAAE